MSPCKELIGAVGKHQRKTKMKCPVRIFPVCHPKSFVDVFVDSRQSRITLTCGACDQVLSTIHIKKVTHAKMDRK